MERLDRGLWLVPAERGLSDAANAGRVSQLMLVRDHERLWLVGSGPSPAFGAALACAIRRDIGRPVTDLVNTRAAPELAMGNIAFGGARRWALADVARAMEQHCETCLQHLAARLGASGRSLEPALIRTPDATVGAAAARHGRLGPFEWLALERAPHERVLVLRLRSRRWVFAQGLLWAGDLPNLAETRSASLLASWRELRRYARGARLLGEQGGIGQASDLDRHMAYLDALRAAVREHLSRADVDGAAGFGVDLPAYSALPGYPVLHPLNLQRVWRELEPEMFAPARAPRVCRSCPRQAPGGS